MSVVKIETKMESEMNNNYDKIQAYSKGRGDFSKELLYTINELSKTYSRQSSWQIVDKIKKILNKESKK